VVLVPESDADPILCKLQCKLSKQLLSPFKPPDAWKTHLKSSVPGSSLRREGGSDPQRATALCSSRQQQQRADRRQQQQHELQTPGDATARSAAQLAGDAGPALKKKLR